MKVWCCAMALVLGAWATGCDDGTEPATTTPAGDVAATGDADASSGTPDGVTTSDVPKTPITCPFSGAAGTAVGDTLGSYELRGCNYVLTDLAAVACGNEATLLVVGAGWSTAAADLAATLNTMWTTYQAAGLEIVQILTEDNPGQPATAGFCDSWVAGHSVEHTVLMDQKKLTAPLFGDIDNTLPMLILVDRDGVISHKWSSVPQDLEAVVAGAL